MALAHPLALVWGLLAIPVVILWWLAGGPRREPVATDMLWQQALAGEGGRSAWQGWRGGASLAVQLSVLALLVVALADPQIPPPRQIVLILDGSPSSNAHNAQPTRLARAKETAQRLAGVLRDCDEMAVLSAGDPPTVHCTLTAQQATLREAVELVPVGTRPAPMDQAIALAREMLHGKRGGQIVTLTAGPRADLNANAALLDLGQPGPPVWLLLSGLAVLLLTGEWCLSERRWIG